MYRSWRVSSPEKSVLDIIPPAGRNINIFSKNKKILKKVLAFLDKVCYHIKAPVMGVFIE